MKRSETATSATTTAAIATQSVDVEGAGVGEGAGGEGSTGSCTVAPFPGVAGATVTFSGLVSARDEATRTVELSLQGVDQQGQVVVQGWMDFVLPEPE